MACAPINRTGDGREGRNNFLWNWAKTWLSGSGPEISKRLKENGDPKPRVWLLSGICCIMQMCIASFANSACSSHHSVTLSNCPKVRCVRTMDRPLVGANARLYSQGRKPLWAFNRDDTQGRSKQCVLHLVAPTNHLEILLKFCNSGLEWAPSSDTLSGNDNAAGVWTTVLTKIWEVLSGRTFQETLLYKGMKKGRGQNDPEESKLVRKQCSWR